MDDAQAWFKEGVALYEKGDYRRATAAFDKAIAIDPTMAEVWNNRGLSLIQTGDYQDALKSINKALSINPYYENARKAKRIVLGLVKEPGTADGSTGGSSGSRPSPAPSAPEGKSSRGLTIAIVAILVIVACGMVIVKDMQGTGSILPFATPTPTPVPTPVPTAVLTATPVPTPTVPVVPTAGIWVEISYDQYYSGSVGTPSAQQMISGSMQVKPNTGTQFYQIPQNNGFVTASVSKNDGSGDNLTVSIYVDGMLEKTASTTTPYGVLDVVAAFPTPGSPPAVGNSSGPIFLPAGTGA